MDTARVSNCTSFTAALVTNSSVSWFGSTPSVAILSNTENTSESLSALPSRRMSWLYALTASGRPDTGAARFPSVVPVAVVVVEPAEAFWGVKSPCRSALSMAFRNCYKQTKRWAKKNEKFKPRNRERETEGEREKERARERS